MNKASKTRVFFRFYVNICGLISKSNLEIA